MYADQPPGKTGICCTTVKLIGASGCADEFVLSTGVSGAASFTLAPSTAPSPSPITSSLVVVLIFCVAGSAFCSALTSCVMALEAGFEAASAETISLESGGSESSKSCDRSSISFDKS